MPNTTLYQLPYAAPGDAADGAGNEQSMMSQTELAVRGQLAIVTLQQLFTSTTTLANVTSIVLPVVANAVYRFDLYLRYSTTAAGSIKIGWVAPASASMSWMLNALDSSVTASFSGISSYAEQTLASTPQLGENAANTMVANPRGLIITGATPGTIQLQAAQQASNATPAAILPNTRLRMWREV